ncbi:hypothetical protein REIS_0503 [Rickettsia endosymbiont of Ixodes scapularis]|nr:hypothetical protein REIS_0503 [Rickettsia endosymbiont of Ixodes scapularis]
MILLIRLPDTLKKRAGPKVIIGIYQIKVQIIQKHLRGFLRIEKRNNHILLIL